MLVRSLRNHYYDGYRKEGDEFDIAGPLYRHVEPVNPADAPRPEKARAAQDPNHEDHDKAKAKK